MGIYILKTCSLSFAPPTPILPRAATRAGCSRVPFWGSFQTTKDISNPASNRGCVLCSETRGEHMFPSTALALSAHFAVFGTTGFFPT